jgi:hypothetical protein
MSRFQAMSPPVGIAKDGVGAIAPCTDGFVAALHQGLNVQICIWCLRCCSLEALREETLQLRNILFCRGRGAVITDRIRQDRVMVGERDIGVS